MDDFFGETKPCDLFPFYFLLSLHDLRLNYLHQLGLQIFKHWIHLIISILILLHGLLFILLGFLEGRHEFLPDGSPLWKHIGRNKLYIFLPLIFFILVGLPGTQLFFSV